MTIYSGPDYHLSYVRIGPPASDVRQLLPETSDVRDSVMHWYCEAQVRKDVLYFSIFNQWRTVGQILLHDINISTGESLVAYHLFRAQDRGQGVGTKALKLLQTFVATGTPLRKLVIITSHNNLASQGIARKCGFNYVGPSREDPAGEVVFMWPVRAAP